MATTYRAKAVVVKVSVGPATGNRVARIIKQGGIIPEGVETEQIKRLLSLDLIEKAPTEETPEDAEAQEAADAEAAAKAAADAEAKAAAEAEAKAKAAASSKTTTTSK